MDTWAIGTDLDFSAILSIPSPQNSGPSHDFSLPTASQIPALKYPLDWTDSVSVSHDAVENEYFPTQYHSTNSDAGSSQHRYPVEPMPGMIDNHLTFPWNGPSSAPATSIHGGTFIGGNVQNIQRHGEAGLHILHRATASGAFHDSAERFPQPRCHPETRTELLNILWNWTCGIEPPKNWTSDNFALSSEEENGPSSCILWLYGPAGAGKSAVAQSFCQKLKDEGRLGGSFFFKRGHPSRGNAHKLFPTIAYQLALHLPQLNQLISQRIERDPAVVDRSLSDQLHQLIIEPCRKTSFPQPVTVIIDGLDECDGEDIQQEILRSIGHAVCQERLPILFFFSSRPESYIRETFVGPCLEGFHRPLNIEQSFQDVRKYLLVELGRIHREHQTTMATVPSLWPQSEIVEKLVQKSSGYFIYASTVVKFIDDKRFRPVDRLDIILGIKNSISRSPFDALDQLYQQILCGVPIDFHAQLLGILTVITAGLDWWVSAIEQLLELETGDVRLILRGLHSVLDIPAEEDTRISAHHASFLDFLRNSSRSGPFYVGSSQCRHNLTHHILKAYSFQTPDWLTNLEHPAR
ncbi:hypothetical protein C8F04DRAFT_537299 [Mycena alexandri]|uniref:Nephrocystin 3-like N-terminal domain-containing protein n=1 Tax=Mycena alexandri TaxID=1745969 RepID=A0AAD6RWD7_9AGAR|nr:hypothetical protein C8F04DRAFT_537299 [Mycena alexandri]